MADAMTMTKLNTHGAPVADWTSRPWLGRWVTTDQAENWQAFVSALDVPGLSDPALFTVILQFWNDGDSFHQEMTIPVKNAHTNSTFRLGHQTEVQHRNEVMKMKHCEVGDKLVVDVSLPAVNKELQETYEVHGDEMIKTYQVGDVVGKRWFRKEPHY